MVSSCRALALLTLAAAVGCASGAAPVQKGEAPAPVHSRTMITEDQIPVDGTESAYELIQRIHPDFLRVRPAQGATGARGTEAPAPTLWINGQRVGEAADLRGIPAASLKTIRYYSIEEAKLRFGMQNPGGAIELTYRTKPDP